ncbi:hypothetical protein TNCV_2763601 [Trichonephila clavipes]|nr:hypothetical protein TNCV_2763601 [Trichonephila clavipes]
MSSTPGDTGVVELMRIKSIETQSLPVGVVWEFGEATSGVTDNARAPTKSGLGPQAVLGVSQVFEITTRSRLASLTTTLHGIPHVVEDFSRQS